MLKPIRYIFLSVFFIWMITSCKKEEKTPPNVLFIAVDDLRAELGVYGGQAYSPIMDAIAAEGTVFKRHYVQAPTCGASRHALLTGMRPSKPIHLSNRAIEKEISNLEEQTNPESFIHQFRRNGYHTVGIGKISHSADGFLYGYEDPISTKT